MCAAMLFSSHDQMRWHPGVHHWSALTHPLCLISQSSSLVVCLDKVSHLLVLPSLGGIVHTHGIPGACVWAQHPTTNTYDGSVQAKLEIVLSAGLLTEESCVCPTSRSWQYSCVESTSHPHHVTRSHTCVPHVDLVNSVVAASLEPLAGHIIQVAPA